MFEEPLTRRRQLLRSATAGCAALLAGCAGLGSHTVGCNFVERFVTPGCQNMPWGYSRQYQDQSDNPDGGSGDTGGTAGDAGEPSAETRQVGVVAALGTETQQALRQLQQGSIDESEFDQQLTVLLEPVSQT